MAGPDPAIALRAAADRHIFITIPIGRRALIGSLLGLCLAGLAGCGGWVPLYADAETAQSDENLRAITVAPIPERIGQKLALALRQSLNPEGIPTPLRYVLRITLQVVRADLGVQSYGLGTRGKLDVYANYVLADSRSNATLLTALSHVAESFDILANEYAATVAETDAGTRAVEELRRDIVNQLTVFMQRGGPPMPGAPPRAR